MKELIQLTVQGLLVTCYEREQNFYLEAKGFGWLISRSYQAEDWRPTFYEFCEMLLTKDFPHLNVHPDDPHA